MKKSDPPGHLSREGKALWRRLLAEYGIDDAGGLVVLAVCCEALDRMRGAQQAVLAEGQTVTDRFGQVKAHPLLSVERDARSAFLQALKSLNLDLEPLQARIQRPGG